MADDRILIVVEPDTSGFQRDLDRDLERVDGELDVEVKADTDDATVKMKRWREGNDKPIDVPIKTDTKRATGLLKTFRTAAMKPLHMVASMNVAPALAALATVKGAAASSFAFVGDAAKKASKQVAVAAAVAAAAFTGIGTASAVNLNKSLREVVTLTGQTGAQADKTFAEFGKVVRGVSDDTGVLQTTISKGLYQALSAGVPSDNAFDFMQVATKASIAGVTDVETAVDGLTTNINAFKLPMQDAQKVADVMFTTVKLGKTNFEQLSQSMFQIAPIASSMGVSVEEASAALATLTKSGVPTSVAATQIRAALVSTAKPTDAMLAAFEKLNVSGFDQLLKRSGSMQGAFKAMADTTGGSNTKMAEMFGSVEAVNAVLGITGKNAQVAKDDLAAMNQAAGATTAAFGEMDKERGFDRLKTEVSTAATSFGQLLVPVLLQVVDLGRQVAGALAPLKRVFAVVGNAFSMAFADVGDGDWIKSLEGAMTDLAVLFEENEDSILAFALVFKDLAVEVGKFVKLVGPILFPVLKMFGLLLAGLVVGITTIATWVLKLVNAFLSWKGAIYVILGALALFLGWPALIATALGLLVALVIRNWDAIVAYIKTIPGKVMKGLNRLAGMLRSFFSKAWALVKAITVTAVKAYIAYVTFIPRMVIAAITALGPMLWNFIKSAWTKFKSITVQLVTGYINFVRSIPGKVVSAIGAVARLLYGKGRDIINGLFDGLKAVWNKVKSWLSGLGDKIKSLKGPIEVDRTLLYDEGAAIMGGFHKGLKEKWGGVEGWLADRGGFIKGMLSKVGLADITDKLGKLFTGEVSIGDVNAALDKHSMEGMHPSSGPADTWAMANIIAKRFNVLISSFLRPGARTTTGNLSQHAVGMAADFSNGSNPTPEMDRLADWARRLIGKAFYQVLYRTMLGGNHFNHVHIGWIPREHGGNVKRSGHYMVGEAGPEAFIPNSSGFILNNARLDRMLNVDRRLANVERGERAPATTGGQTVHQSVTINMPPVQAADGQGWAMLTTNRLLEMLRANAVSMVGGVA